MATNMGCEHIVFESDSQVLVYSIYFNSKCVTRQKWARLMAGPLAHILRRVEPKKTNPKCT